MSPGPSLLLLSPSAAPTDAPLPTLLHHSLRVRRNSCLHSGTPAIPLSRMLLRAALFAPCNFFTLPPPPSPPQPFIYHPPHPPSRPPCPSPCPPTPHTTARDMSSNSLTGSIPDFISTLQKLVYLGLSASGEDGLKGTLPSGLGKLTRLNELYLHRNGLSGPVSVLTSLTKLNRLLLGDNNFNGSFPQGFSNLKSLNYLSMRYNGFEGRIPNVISTLTKLTYLSLNSNNFKGLIPRTITALTKLSNLCAPLPPCLTLLLLTALQLPSPVCC
ncbi:unnamed protein product [Closterium sp. NIES-53]